MKKLMLALALTSIASLPPVAVANDTSPAASKAEAPVPNPNKGFAKMLHHANFMPVFMKAVMRNRVELSLTEEQFTKLKAYKEKNSPNVMMQIKEVVALEKQAKELTLKDGNAQEIIALGEKSFKIRHAIMMSKIECRDFVKSVLTAEQYQKLLVNYGKKVPKKAA